MPDPFRRPRIDLDGARHERREWRHILASDIRTGDIVPGIGRVHTVDEDLSVLSSPDIATTSWTIAVTGGVNNRRVFNGQELVMVFAAVGTER